MPPVDCVRRERESGVTTEVFEFNVHLGEWEKEKEPVVQFDNNYECYNTE